MAATDWRIEEYDELDSTQDELRRRLNAGQTVDRLVIRAAVQTKGRGQRARDWQSSRGGSYQSVALEGRALPASSLFMAIGVAREFNAARPELQLQLKWPNDILLPDGSKVAGVLCEYSKGHLLVGVGVNVGNQAPPGAGKLTGFRLSEANSLVLAGIAAGWELMRERPEELAAAYGRLDSLNGLKLRFERGGRVLEGVAGGVNASGQLRLHAQGGEELVDSAMDLKVVADE